MAFFKAGNMGRINLAKQYNVHVDEDASLPRYSDDMGLALWGEGPNIISENMRFIVLSRASCSTSSPEFYRKSFLAAQTSKAIRHVQTRNRALHSVLALSVLAGEKPRWLISTYFPCDVVAHGVLECRLVFTAISQITRPHPEVRDTLCEMKRCILDGQSHFSLVQWAKSRKVSMRNLQRKFNANIFCSPKSIWVQKKVEWVCGQIAETDHSFSVLAQFGGFYDQAVFCRQFKGITGMTPVQYKTSMKRL